MGKDPPFDKQNISKITIILSLLVIGGRVERKWRERCYNGGKDGIDEGARCVCSYSERADNWSVYLLEEYFEGGCVCVCVCVQGR